MRRRTACGSFVAVVVLAGACSDPMLPPTLLTVSPSPLTLALGETANLSTSLRDANGAAVIALVAWSSSAPSVVSVNDGFVTALQPGTAEIIASTSGLSSSASVTVQDQEAPTVTITSPVSGTTVAGVVTVAARVNDDHKVASVTLTVDGVEVDSSEPAGGTGVTASLTWDSNDAANGAHLLIVEATDSTGNIGSAFVGVDVDIDTPPFVLSLSGTVTSSGYNTLTRRDECTSVLTATAFGGAVDARAEWQSGQIDFRDVHGIVTSTLSLDAGDLLDYFGSSHISTGATQIVNRVDRSTRPFDLLYTFRAAMPDSTVSSVNVFLDCY